MTQNKFTPTRVLVVDETAITRTRLCALLSELPSTVVDGCTANPSQALSRSKSFRPHCIVMDVSARGCDAFELLASLRRLYPACRLIAVTNQEGEEFSRRSIAAGADHFLSKATELERVGALVHRSEPA